MLFKTRGIVLHTVKYGDNSLVCSVYCEKFGRQSFFANATHGGKSSNKAVLMQPLFLLEMEVYEKKGREVQRIKESRVAEPYLSIPFDIRKATQALFLAEVLYKLLQEEESNPPLFHFIENSLLFFDQMEKGTSNFHIWFLARLTEYLGILPRIGKSDEGWLDMKLGMVVNREPVHAPFLNPGMTSLLKSLLSIHISDLPGLKITNIQRNHLLNKLLEYIHLHFESFSHLKSLAVLKDVFDQE